MWRTVRDGMLILFFTVVFAAAIKSCVIDAYKIPTESMRETLLPGDFLLVNKFIYTIRTPEKILFVSFPKIILPGLSTVSRGDVVVFNFPGEPNEVYPVRNQYLVKRCIALPGDTVEITNANLVVNGFRSERSYSQFDTIPFFSVVPFRGMEVKLDPSTLKQWNVFVKREGHAVDISGDSIMIDGRATSIYTVENNYYFVVGDNPQNSYDSRHWGFVPEENIVGKAMAIYWSKDEQSIRWERIGTLVR